ncbi:class I SAM-dependent methyltransferase [Amycolatopsis acidicola]|uniref:class I SAM-dependent methyltransferase n=1 Tax=Amycolatopsis acidicola TaxID=2596893 RepID=UPI001AA019F0|nr:class I SAM-dependent methyltransferase [Amycolatopsis acidicola]
MSFSPDWLALREQADATARSTELLAPLGDFLDGATELTVRDLGCGTGSMGRWLSGRLPAPQRWILHDHDPALLAQARLNLSARGPVLAVETREGDLTGLRAEDLTGTSLVTASALLDLLTAEEVNRLAAACVHAGSPALLTLSVAGRVEMTPAEPLDTAFTAAFNAHQRRGLLLGPDAPAVTAAAFRALGASVHSAPSPWRLGPRNAALTAEWLRGWVAAACEQDPGLTRHADAYLRRRSQDGVEIVVHHEDLLALPGAAS